MLEDSTETEQITNAVYSNREFFDPAINSLGQIAHVCELENDRFDICLINPDGSDLRRVTLTSPYAINLEPDINDAGMIVFGCRSEDSRQFICIIDAGSTEARELELNVRVKEFPRIQIDNAGRILFPCLSLVLEEDLCIVNSDGSDLRFLNKIQDRSETNSSGHMNNNGQVVFFCRSQSLGQGICRADLETLDVELLVKNSEERQDTNPLINDSGQIVFNCNFQRLITEDICVTAWESGEVRRLTEAERGEFNFASAITPNGVIAFRCSVNSNDNLCTINFDGFNSRQLTFLSENEKNSEPDINNNGQIVFRCENADGDLEACFIDNIDSPEVNLSDQYGIDRVFDLDMNDRGEIALSCEFQDGGNNLCVIDLEQERIEILNDNPGFQGHGVFGVSINNLGIIAYECTLSSRSNICYSNADGSEGGILIKDDGVGQAFFSVSINDLNQIVFSCEFESFVRNVCLIDLESNLSMVTADATRFGIHYNEPEINNVGRLSVSCSDSKEDDLLLHVCSVNSDGSDFVNHAINSTETLPAHESAINDQNIVVYACRSSESNAIDLCVIPPQPDGTFVEDRVIREWSNLEPSINNQNEIVYRCTGLLGNRNICYHNLQTGETKQLTFIDSSGRVFDITSQ